MPLATRMFDQWRGLRRHGSLSGRSGNCLASWSIASGRQLRTPTPFQRFLTLFAAFLDLPLAAFLALAFFAAPAPAYFFFFAANVGCAGVCSPLSAGGLEGSPATPLLMSWRHVIVMFFQ